MKYARVGRTGLIVSKIGIGSMNIGTPGWRPWVLGEDEARGVFSAALDAGINLFDTADVYSEGAAEEVLGRVLFSLTDRDNLVLATKAHAPMASWPNRGGLSRKHLLSAIDASLRRFGTDYIDIFQIHRWDPDTPIDETMGALEDIVRAGKARYIGASNLFAWQLAKANHAAAMAGTTPFSSVQMHYNLLHREDERELVPLVLADGLGMFSWSPLARGMLARRADDVATARAEHDTRTREMYQSDIDTQIAAEVRAIAAARGVEPSQIALAWQHTKEHITAPIIGASHPEHVTSAAASVDIDLDGDEIARLEDPYRPREPMGHIDAALVRRWTDEGETAGA